MKTFEMIFMPVNLYAFDGDLNTNVTTDSGLTPLMRTYYSDLMIDLAEPKLVHDQFAQKVPIPQGNGKSVNFHRYAPLPTLTVPLVEGITPDGQKIEVSDIEATVEQYGGYVGISDIVKLTEPDNILLRNNKLLAGQAGRTLDTITREELVTGTNVRYAGGKTSRTALTTADTITVKDIKKAVRDLKKMNAEPVSGGYFAGIISPDVSFDLTEDPDWKYPHQYVDTENIYSNEIGAIAGVRFVETSEAKVFKGAGASSADVFATLIIGDNAYGVTELSGGGLEFIVKQLGSGGTADPLNQRGTTGWKATKAAKILVDEYMVRIESSATAD